MLDRTLFGIRIVANLYDQNAGKISIVGCHSFSIRNLGTVKATVFGSVDIEPGQIIPFPNVENLPYLEDTDLVWDSIPAAGINTKYKLQVIKAIIIDKTAC